MYDLSGKVTLVTGAGGERGMGRAIATRLAQEGADIVINDVAENPYADRPSEWRGLPDLVREIEAMGRRTLGIVTDITDSAQVDNMVRQAMDHFGHIDILVNNPAARQGRDLVPVVELEEEVWDLTQRVNVKGTFLCSRAVAREMIRRGEGGKIIIISSTAGKLGLACAAAYSASKFALIGFTQSLALELAPSRINVNAICPSSVDTQRTHDITAAMAPEGKSEQEQYADCLRLRDSENPLGRIGQTSDVARMAAFLASSESDYITGESILVSGGSQLD